MYLNFFGNLDYFKMHYSQTFYVTISWDNKYTLTRMLNTILDYEQNKKVLFLQ